MEQPGSTAYLDLLQETLLGLNWDEGDRPVQEKYIRGRFKKFAFGLLKKALHRYDISLHHKDLEWRAKRLAGSDWPDRAWSMIGATRMTQLRQAAETVLRENVPGDFLEAGVWRGGASILLRGVLHAWGDLDRVVWCADSFDGLPPPEAPADAGDRHYTYRELAVPLDEVIENFKKFSLFDDRVRFLPGLFDETLPNAPVEKLSLLRLDGDMYSSTRATLTALYHKVSPGGFVIVDEFEHPPCQQACLEFLEEHQYEAKIEMIDHTGAYWRKQPRQEVGGYSGFRPTAIRETPGTR